MAVDREMLDYTRQRVGLPRIDELERAADSLQHDETSWRDETDKRIADAVRKLIGPELEKRMAHRRLSDKEIQSLAAEIVQRRLDDALRQLDSTVL